MPLLAASAQRPAVAVTAAPSDTDRPGPTRSEHPTFVVDDGGGLVSLDAHARAALDAGEPLTVVLDRLVPAAGSERPAWLRAVSRAALERGDSIRVLSTRAGPVAAAVTSNQTPGLATVRLERPLPCGERTLRAYAQAIGLTDAEVRALRLLLAGLPPKTIATRAGVTESTVRTQIRGVLSKSGCDSIRAMLLRLARLPDLG